MIVRSKSLFIAPALAVLLLGGLTACSPSTGSSGGGSTPGGSSGGSGASGSTNVCNLISASAAGSALGATYTGAKAGTLSTGEDACTYAASGSPDALIVTVYEPSSGTNWTTFNGVLESVGPVKAISGVGDKASLGGTQLDVEAGSRFIAIEGDAVTSNPSGAEALAKKLISALG
jgi:hypothetical protein